MYVQDRKESISSAPGEGFLVYCPEHVLPGSPREHTQGCSLSDL